MCNTDSELDQRRDENCMGLEIYEIAIMSTRPVHKNLFFGNSKKVDKKTNVGKGVLLKFRSFIKFWEPPILQGRIHRANLPE